MSKQMAISVQGTTFSPTESSEGIEGSRTARYGDSVCLPGSGDVAVRAFNRPIDAVCRENKNRDTIYRVIQRRETNNKMVILLRKPLCSAHPLCVTHYIHYSREQSDLVIGVIVAVKEMGARQYSIDYNCHTFDAYLYGEMLRISQRDKGINDQ
ncbi:hypothetical protein DdX_08450 [Ditylenchus destructor]|uniref:Uncharacterized protein n=1 Tax=Ditylenchus destructor TaxID=166010 RepID=A0AAD4N210_9BILA|nr:hypothetical protein DdX_08450 [Ditylenchus destructor]